MKRLRRGLSLAGTRVLASVFSAALAAQSLAQTPAEMARWKAEAARVYIVRDDWGIAHVHGHTDADAVFGMIYTQCEDDFARVEANYLTSLGRKAEAEGESALWADLRQRLFLDPDNLKKQYAGSPEWLKALMNAWADGANFYLAQHPDVHPRAITHFEPWMALSFTEGSIGGDIERVNTQKLQDFYDSHTVHALGAGHPGVSKLEMPDMPTRAASEASTRRWFPAEPGGSNGIAIAPSNTVDHHALLLINPHTWFYFRSELQMSSDQGLDAYGAVTWGQFFVYQGFNERAGWMHTSSYVDAVDEYLETVVNDGGELQYRYAGTVRRFEKKKITLTYKTPTGMASRTFTALYTVHGPVIRQEGNRFVTIQLMNIPVPALEQSYLRTKAHTYAEYKRTMELRANSSNNTVFADADGDIAYWHGDFIPNRDTRFDYTMPVDGSTPETNWHGLETVDQVPHLLNPASGYLFNVNDSPWNGAGESSLRRQDYPVYVDEGIKSARTVHAMHVLAPEGKTRRNFSMDGLLAAAYDSEMPWFERTVPLLLKAYDALPQDASTRSQLAPQIAALRGWNERWAADSVPTSLAVYWGTELLHTIAAPARAAKVPTEEWVADKLSGSDLLAALAAATEKLTADFGTWQTPWGEINRFQRLTDDVDQPFRKTNQPFRDAAPSIPVPFASALWGSLASFASKPYPETKRWYGNYGNSFVAVVEFGPRVRARAITAGGESGHPGTKHFDDEAARYASGNLREVYFYPDQLKGHTERTYHPGE